MPRRTRSASDLRQIAWYQKFLMLCMVAYVVTWVGFILLMATGADEQPGEEDSPFRLALLLTGLIGLVGAVFVVLIGLKVSGPAGAVVFGILTLIPCVSLFMIVIVNVQATGVLQRNGVRVGLIGARIADINDLPAFDPDEDDDSDNRPRRRRRRSAEIDEDEGW
jgi:hypothetical protein